MEPPPAGPEGEGTTPLPQFRSSPIAPQKCFPTTKSKLTAGGSGAEGRDGGDGKKSEGGELHGCDTVTGKEKSGFSQGARESSLLLRGRTRCPTCCHSRHSTVGLNRSHGGATARNLEGRPARLWFLEEGFFNGKFNTSLRIFLFWRFPCARWLDRRGRLGEITCSRLPLPRIFDVEELAER